MPTTINNLAKHGDFTVEHVEQIKKDYDVVNKREAFWGPYCQPDNSDYGDTLKYRVQILQDTTLAADTLAEDVIPDPKKIRVVELSATTYNVGSYVQYGREQLKNRDSYVDMASNQLSHERLVDLEAGRWQAYLGTTVAATKGADENWEAFLLRQKTQLKKNKAKPIDGRSFLFIAPGEIMNQITVELGDKLKACSAGEEAIVSGAIGKCSGFIFVENDEEEMYGTKAGYALCIGKTELGTWPVTDKHGPVEVISNGIDQGDKNDPLNQFGTLGSRIDNVRARLTHAACVIKATVELTPLTSAYNPAAGATKDQTSPAA